MSERGDLLRVATEGYLSQLDKMRCWFMACFRHVRCANTRADLVQECLSHAWEQWLSMMRRGIDPVHTIGGVLKFVALHVRAGNRPFVRVGRKRKLQKGSRGSQWARLNEALERGQLADTERFACYEGADFGPDRVAAHNLDWSAWIASLPAWQREFLTAYLDARTLTRVCRALGIGKQTAMSRLTRLRESWEAFIADRD